ncbi:hypothetical protein SAMN05216391_11767 [Lachnospiraceae bacterium KHCPX20]|nr:hypothetical protein SAMN05216391_11767 [Lachnospiraceae bacterium KHCPX20]
MKKNSVEERIGCIFTGEQVSRIHIEEDHDVVTEVEADVHGMSCSEARLFLHNLIALLRFPFKLIVIHGYVHGTAIKEMLYRSFSEKRLSEFGPVDCNYGITWLQIA